MIEHERRTGRATLWRMTMAQPEVFIGAAQALEAVVGRTGGAQWGQALPDWFPVAGSTDGLTVRDVVAKHAYDLAWVPDTLAGRTLADVGDAHDGDLLAGDPPGRFAELTSAAVAAARAADLDRTVELTYGPFPARDYLSHISTYHGLHARDLARSLGQDDVLPAPLVQGLWDEISPEAEMWRSLGVFGPAVAVPAGAPLQDRLMGLTGREP